MPFVTGDLSDLSFSDILERPSASALMLTRGVRTHVAVARLCALGRQL